MQILVSMSQVKRDVADAVAADKVPFVCGTRAIFKPYVLVAGISVQVLLLLLDNADECLENQPKAFRETVRHVLSHVCVCVRPFVFTIDSLTQCVSKSFR